MCDNRGVSVIFLSGPIGAGKTAVAQELVETARKILKEVRFDFVLLRPSLEVCVERASSREAGAIKDHTRMKNFYALLEDGSIEAISDDNADPSSLAQRIAKGLEQGRFRVD